MINHDTLKWAAGGLIAAMMSWGTWVTATVWEDRARLARIETKLDILVDRVIPPLIYHAPPESQPAK